MWSTARWRARVVSHVLSVACDGQNASGRCQSAMKTLWTTSSAAAASPANPAGDGVGSVAVHGEGLLQRGDVPELQSRVECERDTGTRE
jgi:hypothetical protein